LLALLEKLQEKEIYPIVMKGCHLIRSIYPFGIRPIEDIDILLDRKHYREVEEVLRSLGYENRAVVMDVWTHVEVSNKMTYMNASQPIIPIDVHYSLGPYPYLGRIPFEALRGLSNRMTANGVQLLVLQPEMLLVHLCLHLLQHQDEHWEKSAYDLSAITILQQEQISWEQFITIVKKYSLALPIRHSIEKARRLAEIRLPEPVMEEIGSTPVGRKERYIFQASLSMNEGMEKYILQFLTLPGLKAKLKCLQKIAFPRKAFLKRYYNGNYPKYVLDIGFKAVRAIFRAIY